MSKLAGNPLENKMEGGKTGRKPDPNVQHNPENSSRKGLQQEWTRATFIIRDDILDALKSKAYENHQPIKALVHQIFADYLKREGWDPETVKEMKEKEQAVKDLYKNLQI